MGLLPFAEHASPAADAVVDVVEAHRGPTAAFLHSRHFSVFGHPVKCGRGTILNKVTKINQLIKQSNCQVKKIKCEPVIEDSYLSKVKESIKRNTVSQYVLPLT